VDDDWLGTREAADHLGIGVKLLYRLIEQGQIPAKRERKGRTILVRRRDLDAYLCSTQIAPGELAHLSTLGPVVAEGNS
jgi:excisionase family DNA binding protein